MLKEFTLYKLFDNIPIELRWISIMYKIDGKLWKIIKLIS